jgi:hypothetical protein
MPSGVQVVESRSGLHFSHGSHNRLRAPGAGPAYYTIASWIGKVDAAAH